MMLNNVEQGRREKRKGKEDMWQKKESSRETKGWKEMGGQREREFIHISINI